MTALLGIALLSLTHAESNAKPKDEGARNRIENINSDEIRMEVKDDQTTDVRLKGSVDIAATQFRLRADFAEGTQNSNGEFVVGYAKGNVRIFLPDTMLRGERLDYDKETKKAILTCETGKPKAWKSGKVIEAPRIIYDLSAKESSDDSRRVIIDGGVSVSDSPMPPEHAEVYPPKADEPSKEPEK